MRSERQAALAGAIGKGRDTAVVTVASAVEDHALDASCLGTLGNELAEVMLAGVLVLFGTLVGIFVLCSGFAGPGAGRIAALLWAGSPMALYNFVGYSEPLFALLCAWTFVSLYRGNLWMAAALASMALLMQWLAQVDHIPLADSVNSFYSLALRFVGGYSPAKFFRGSQEAMVMAISWLK